MTHHAWTAPGSFVVKRTLLSEKARDNSGPIALLSVMVISAISLLCWREYPDLFLTLAAVPERVNDHGEYWRLLTAMAVHSDWRHLVSNACFLALFAYLLYGYFGFWVYPFGAVVLGAFTNYLSLLTYSPEIRLVGASGLAYLMAGFWLTIYILTERSRPIRKRLLRSFGFGLIVLIPTTLQQNVSYRTHTIGFALGVIMALLYFQRRKQVIRAAEVVEWEEDPDESPSYVM